MGLIAGGLDFNGRNLVLIRDDKVYLVILLAFGIGYCVIE